MISFTSQTDDTSVAVVRLDDRRSICLVAEAAVSLHGNADVLSSLLTRLLSIHTDDLLALANDLGDHLRGAEVAERLPPWVFFAGVAVQDSVVEACVAGPHRIHVLRGETVLASTREHILRFDEPPPDWPVGALDAEARALHGSIVTRSLGKAASRRAELTTWKVSDANAVLVVSADFHLNAEPASYVTIPPPTRRAGSFALLRRYPAGSAR